MVLTYVRGVCVMKMLCLYHIYIYINRKITATITVTVQVNRPVKPTPTSLSFDLGSFSPNKLNIYLHIFYNLFFCGSIYFIAECERPAVYSLHTEGASPWLHRASGRIVQT